MLQLEEIIIEQEESTIQELELDLVRDNSPIQEIHVGKALTPYYE